ncbi:MAG: outer membrane protein assembly factor BamA [Acidobacteria bacterium]|nr:outer membrane protein assembly factor BamA [Acidobacteriota bacterium]
MFEGFIVDKVTLTPDGKLTEINEANLRKLILIRTGDRYEAMVIRQCIERLFSTHLFFDVQIDVQVLSPGHCAVDFKMARNVYINRLRFSGDRKLDTAQLLRQVTFREKESFDREALEGTISRLFVFYEKNGYFRSQITPKLIWDKSRSVVDIDLEIRAGDRARVEKLVFDVELPANASVIREEIKTRQGEKYSGAVLDEDIQDLTRQFALLGYLNADIYIKENSYNPERNTVSVTIRINPRDFVNVDVRGIELSHADKWDLLPLFPERSTEPVFVQESAQNLQRYLQERGHYFAAVKPAIRTELPRTVILDVERGKKFSLAGIRFENITPLEEGELRGVLALRLQSLFSRGVYTSQTLADDLERIRNLFVQKGYADARVEPRLEPRDEEAFVIFRVSAGPQFHVNSLEIVGNRAFDDQTLLDSLQSRAGGIYSPYTVAVDRSILITMYENAGFSNIDFRSDIHYPFPGLADITYYLNEGDRYTIENVVITGNRITRDHVIQRELALVAGEQVSLEKLLTTESNLYNLGVFNRVSIEADPTFQNPFQKILRVHLEEAEHYTLIYGAGYEDADPRVTVGISDTNFLGMARTLGTAFRVGARQQRGQIGYTLPRPFGWRLPTLLSLFAQHERKRQGDLQEDLGKPFDTTRLTAQLQSERRINRPTSLFFRFNYEKVSVSNIEELEALFRENRPVRLARLSVSLLNDSRDNPLNANRGTFNSVDLQLTPRFLGSEAQFMRLFAQQQYFQPVAHGLVFAVSERFGLLKPFGKNTVDTSLPVQLQNPIPISERFFAGGSTSLRGFRLDQAGPLVEKTITIKERAEKRLVPIGGNALLIWNAELRFPVFRFIRGVLFYDTGNVFRNAGNISLKDFSHAVGFGLRLNTPVGPLRADFGYNLNPPPNFKKELFFFNIGQTF